MIENNKETVVIEAEGICSTCTNHDPYHCPLYYQNRKINSCSKYKGEREEKRNSTEGDLYEPYGICIDREYIKKIEPWYVIDTPKYTYDFIERLQTKIHGEEMFLSSPVKKVKTNNEIKNEGGKKGMEEKNENIEEKISNIKELIKETKEERRKKIKNSSLKEVRDVIMYIWNNDRKHTIKKDFIKYMKSFSDNTLRSVIKLMENFKCKTVNKIKDFHYLTDKLIELPKEEWENFEYMLSIIDEYYPKYILNKQQKELCHLTDCYKKLATEKRCHQCKSLNPIESNFCNNCGEKL